MKTTTMILIIMLIVLICGLINEKESDLINMIILFCCYCICKSIDETKK